MRVCYCEDKRLCPRNDGGSRSGVVCARRGEEEKKYGCDKGN